MSAGEPKRGKAGRSAQAVAERQKTFVEAYLSNGHNAAQAAIAAGTGGKYQKPAVQALLAKRAKEIAELVEMNTQNGAEELRAIAFSDVGDLVDDRGKPIPMSELPPHVRACDQLGQGDAGRQGHRVQVLGQARRVADHGAASRVVRARQYAEGGAGVG